MFAIYYTDHVTVDSSAVEDVWYDSTTGALYLQLHGSIYQYSEVAQGDYENLVNASSVGQYYQQHIRGTYKPARLLGSALAAQEIQKSVKATEIHQTRAKVQDTPQLKLSEDVPSKRDDLLDHTINFTVDGSDKQHVVRVASVDDALDQFLSLASKLGVAATVKSVLVTFE